MTDQVQDPSAPTLRGTIMSLNPKIVLAFFLVVIAAALLVFFTVMLQRNFVDGKSQMDAGTIALLGGFVTLFIKMAADGIGYQFNSSSGSEKKDDTLARAVPTAANGDGNAAAAADKAAPGAAEKAAPAAARRAAPPAAEVAAPPAAEAAVDVALAERGLEHKP